MLLVFWVIKLLQVMNTEHGVNPEIAKSCKGKYIIAINELIWNQPNQIKLIMYNKYNQKKKAMALVRLWISAI